MTSLFLIINPHNQKVFLQWQQDKWSLPWVSGPDRHFDVAGLPQMISHQLGLSITLLCCLQTNPRVYAAEALSPSPTSSKGQWFGIEELAGLDAQHQELLDQYALGKLLPPNPPWAKLGWYYETEKWYAEKLKQAGMPATGPADQIKVWGLSWVGQIPTTKGWVWFKALPPIFYKETRIVRYLDKKYPGTVPSVIATDDEKGWMLTGEIGGRPLSETDDSRCWAAALKRYAQLQQQEVPYAQELTAIADEGNSLIHRAHLLAESLPELAEAGILPQELAAAWTTVISAIEAKWQELAIFQVPDTLQHGDLHCGNIHITDTSVVFFDWTDWSISHPFFSLIPFLKECDFPAPVKEQLLNIYLSSWADFLNCDIDLKKAWELAQPLALVDLTWAYYLIAKSLWHPGSAQTNNSLANLVRDVLAAFSEPSDIQI